MKSAIKLTSIYPFDLICRHCYKTYLLVAEKWDQVAQTYPMRRNHNIFTGRLELPFVNVFNWFTIKSIYDTRSFYSVEPCANRNACAADQKNAWTRQQSHIWSPQAPRNNLNHAKKVKTSGEGPWDQGPPFAVGIYSSLPQLKCGARPFYCGEPGTNRSSITRRAQNLLAPSAFLKWGASSNKLGPAEVGESLGYRHLQMSKVACVLIY